MFWLNFFSIIVGAMLSPASRNSGESTPVVHVYQLFQTSSSIRARARDPFVLSLVISNIHEADEHRPESPPVSRRFSLF